MDMKIHENLPLDDYIEYPEQDMILRSRDFYNEIKRRHSVRKFSDRHVPKEIIENCIRSAGTAPSGANHQPWHFAAISDPKVKALVKEKAETEESRFYLEKRAGEEWLNALAPLGTDEKKPYLEIAPWLIAIFAKRKGGISGTEEVKNYYVPESVGIATGFLINALHSCGLATLTHTPKPMNFLNEICHRPETDKPFILLITGYPAQDATVPAHSKIKKPLDEICTFI